MCHLNVSLNVVVRGSDQHFFCGICTNLHTSKDKFKFLMFKWDFTKIKQNSNLT